MSLRPRVSPRAIRELQAVADERLLSRAERYGWLWPNCDIGDRLKSTKAV